MDSFDILVIILSVTLAIFLVTSIVAILYIIKILKRLNKVAESAEQVASNIEDASKTIKNTAGPASLIKMFMGAYNSKKDK
jgi:hypothetical protein